MIVEVNNEKMYTEKVYSKAELLAAIADAETRRSEASQQLDILSLQAEKAEAEKAEAEAVIAKFEAALAEFPADVVDEQADVMVGV